MSSIRTALAVGAPVRERCLICVALLTFGLAAGGAPATAQDNFMALDKTGSLDLGPDILATPGDLINYQFVVTNQDTECQGPLTNVSVTDPLVTVIDCPSGNPIPSIPFGGSETCTGDYAITQDDINAGSVYNLATAQGNFCTETTTSATDDHLEPVPQVPAIELDKQGVLDLGGDGVATPGDVIGYTFLITNTGNVPLADATLSDPEFAMFDCPSGHPIPTLAPGADETCTASYGITQGDIDAGVKSNTADVVATVDLLQPAVQQVSDQDTASVTIPQVPGIQLTKSGTLDLGSNGQPDPGDLVDYDLVVTNPGNVTLSNVAISDPMITPVTCPGGNPIPTLAPGGAETCTGSYALTAADIAAGTVDNTATATGDPPTTETVSDDDTDTVELPAVMPTTGAWGLVAMALALVAVRALALRRRSRLG